MRNDSSRASTVILPSAFILCTNAFHGGIPEVFVAGKLWRTLVRSSLYAQCREGHQWQSCQNASK